MAKPFVIHGLFLSLPEQTRPDALASLVSLALRLHYAASDVLAADNASLSGVCQNERFPLPAPCVKLGDVRTVADKPGVSPRTVYRLADAGRMPQPLKLGSLRDGTCRKLTIKGRRLSRSLQGGRPMRSQSRNQAEGERRKADALALLAARRELVVRRAQRALLRALESGTATADDVRAVELPLDIDPKVFGRCPWLSRMPASFAALVTPRRADRPHTPALSPSGRSWRRRRLRLADHPDLGAPIRTWTLESPGDERCCLLPSSRNRNADVGTAAGRCFVMEYASMHQREISTDILHNGQARRPVRAFKSIPRPRKTSRRCRLANMSLESSPGNCSRPRPGAPLATAYLQGA